MEFMPTDHYNAGQVIFEEGYPADGVYFICSGKVDISNRRGDKRTHLATLGEGSIFGEMAFIDERPRTATVTAIEDTWCYRHNKDSFLAKIKGLDPAVSRIFHDLVEVVGAKNKAQVLIDHGKIHSLYDAGNSGIYIDETAITPSRPKSELLADKNLQAKISELDLFMRTLFSSLVDIAYSA